MPTTMPVRTSERHYHEGKLVDERLALRWGLTAGSAHQRRILLARWCADVVEELVHDPARLEAFLAPIREAETHGPVPTLDPDFFHRLTVADASEDCSRAAFQAHADDPMRRRRFRADLFSQLAATQAAIRALDQAEDVYPGAVCVR